VHFRRGAERLSNVEFRISTIEYRNSNIEFGTVRVHLCSTFRLVKGELKGCVRKNKGKHAGIAPEEEVSQNGPAGWAHAAGLGINC
jgi:hypothetical protein